MGALRDLVAVALDGSGAVETVVGSEFNELDADISPDGAWIAFESD